MRILFTGGSGKAGRHVVPHLVSQGHRVVNVDLTPLEIDGVDNLIADVTDGAQMFNAMMSYGDFDELDAGTGFPKFDAVVHFAAVPRILIVPDNETYRINTIGTYNVLEAATKMGIRKIIFASSETVYGICFADGARLPDYIPVDEEHPTVPEDSYAISKVANEVTAAGFQRRTGADIYGIRINNVVEPHEYEQDFPRYFADPLLRKRGLFAYIDARDLAQMVERMLGVDGLGYEVFNCCNDENSVARDAEALRKEHYEGIEQRAEIAANGAFYSSEKAKRMLGFAPRHNWMRYVDAPTKD